MSNIDPVSTSVATGDNVSEQSTAHSISTPLETPATSYSSYSSANDREAKKSGMYKLSGSHPIFELPTLANEFQWLTGRELFCRYVFYPFSGRRGSYSRC